MFQAQFSTEALGFDENETKFMSFVIMRWDTALTPATLARRAKVSRQAVITVEGDENETMDYRRAAVLQKLQAVLENDFGIEFQKATKGAGPGVRLRIPKP